MSAVSRSVRRGWDRRPAVREVGRRDPGRRAPASAGPSGRRQRPRRLECPAQTFIALRRPTTTESAARPLGSASCTPAISSPRPRSIRSRPPCPDRHQPDTFSWRLETGQGLRHPGGRARVLRRGARWHERRVPSALSRPPRPGVWRDRVRPVLLNNWEATYFDFDAGKLVAIATSARDLGVELFVLDDGWFGARDDDATVPRRLVRRYAQVARRPGRPRDHGRIARASLRALGRARDGLGAKPAVRVTSRLGRRRSGPAADGESPAARPRHVPHGDRRPPVRRPVARPGERPISYIKWDMNLNITEPYSAGLPPERQGEFFHRYILGVYDLYSRLTTGIPRDPVRVVRGRRRPVSIRHARLCPQAWTSDDTDAIERLAHPVGHVPRLPAERDGRARRRRPEPPDRADHADRDPRRGRLLGAFGSRARSPTSLSEADRAIVAAQIAFYKDHRELLQAWPAASPAQPVRERLQRDRLDGRCARPAHAIVGFFRALNRPVPPADRPEAARPRSRAGLSGQRLAMDDDPIVATTPAPAAATS